MYNIYMECVVIVLGVMVPSIQCGILDMIPNIFNPGPRNDMSPMNRIPMHQMPPNNGPPYRGYPPNNRQPFGMPMNNVPPNRMPLNNMRPNGMSFNNMPTNEMPPNEMPSQDISSNDRPSNVQQVPDNNEFSGQDKSLYNQGMKPPTGMGFNNNQFFNNNQNDTASPDYDKIVAERFPEAASLLEKLKELNRQKEEQKKKEEQNRQENGNNDKPPSNQEDIQTPNTPCCDQNKNQRPCKECKYILKPIKKKEFYFRAQPVRPENEVNRSMETIYYLDY